MFQLSEVILKHRPDLKINVTTTYVPVVQPGGQKEALETLGQVTMGQESPDPEALETQTGGRTGRLQ